MRVSLQMIVLHMHAYVYACTRTCMHMICCIHSCYGHNRFHLRLHLSTAQYQYNNNAYKKRRNIILEIILQVFDTNDLIIEYSKGGNYNTTQCAINIGAINV